MNIKTIKIITVISSIALFLFSLTQKCYCTGNSGCGDSLAVLLTGWMGVFTGTVAAFPWLANPMMVYGWISIFKNQKESLMVSGVSTALCFSFLFFSEIIDNEGGVYSKITGYQIGYWAWAFSSLILLAGNTICYYKGKNTSKF